MFSTQHFIWLGISLVLIVVISLYLNKKKPDLKKVLTVMCVVGLTSEFLKIFGSITLVPSSDGTRFYPYMELSQLPFHLCSMQIILIFYTRFAKESSRKEMILAFMYPTCLIGAFCALLMPTPFVNGVISPSQAFTHPLGYQFFLYHTALVILGIYIPRSGQVKLQGKHYFTTLAILGVLGFLSLYLNSILAVPTYEDGVLVAVEYTTNFLFTYQTPIGLALTEIWQWYLYLIILAVLAIVLVAIFYLPYLRRDYGKKKRGVEKTE